MNEEIYNPTFQKISTVALLVSIITIVITFSYLIFSLIDSTPSSDYQKKVVANYMYGDRRIYDGTYLYYNGNNFINLSLADGSRYPLTTYNFLTNIESIYWLKNGAVFNFTDEPFENDLSNAIEAKMFEINNNIGEIHQASIENIYWYVNFSSGEITYLTYTEHPFGVMGSNEGDYVYFADDLADSNSTYFGSVDTSGEIRRNIFSASPTAPARIIGQKGNELYIVHSEDENTISLQKFNTETYETENIMHDIYYSDARHTIYEDVIIVDNFVVTITSSEDGETVSIIRTDLSTKEKSIIYSGSESSVIEYIGEGRFNIADTGDGAIKTHVIDSDGDIIHAPIVTQKTELHSSLLFSDSYEILISRPYVYMKNGANVATIDDKGIEKGFKSSMSSLERNIYSLTGDFNSYYFMLRSDNLDEEYAKLTDYLQSIDVNRNDVTVIPRIDRRAIPE